MLLAVPIVDRGSEHDPRKRKLMVVGFLIAILLFVGLTVAGALAPMGQHLGP